MKKSGGFGGCLLEIFGELALYVIFLLIGGGVLALIGFLPDDIDSDLVVLIGIVVFAAVAFAVGLPIYLIKMKNKRENSKKSSFMGYFMEKHKFSGKWISDSILAQREPRNVFHRQLEKIDLPFDECGNAHILFRKRFNVVENFSNAKVFITADDCYKLYVNGSFVCMGPAPAYHLNYNYNTVDITSYLHEGENTVAIHTYYQGLINRVWQSGDYRQGLLMDIEIDGEIAVKSDESFLVHRHTAYSECGRSGYDTQFMERYDSRAAETNFYLPEFDDSAWESAFLRTCVDYTLVPQRTKMLEFERIEPVNIEKNEKIIFVDFGKMYVGTLCAKARGKADGKIMLKLGQELEESGRVRSTLRCNCNYSEEWILSGGEDTLNQFDYKAFRYAEIICEDDAEIYDVSLLARHYPFELKAALKEKYASDEDVMAIWELCVHSLKYGVQETIQDCPDREKGFYLGDGCYDAFTHYILTKDDSMIRKLIDDAFASSFICRGLMTCMSCSFMQEIAEYPLIMPDLLLWHYKAEGDIDYLIGNIEKMKDVLDFYRENYEKNYILNDLDRWCVVEWPKNYQDGYAADVAEGRVSREAHIAINAYYYRAISVLNKLCDIAGRPQYRSEKEIYDAIIEKFYDREAHLFVDGEEHRHISLAGNAFPYAFDMAPDEEFEANFRRMLSEKGEDRTSFFTTFPIMLKLTRDGDEQEVDRYIHHSGTWKRMLREGATSTFEGWGKDCKWNTSLFHLTMSSVAMFIANIDLRKFLE